MILHAAFGKLRLAQCRLDAEIVEGVWKMLRYLVGLCLAVVAVVAPGWAAEPPRWVDEAAETASHVETAPLEVAFDELTALRLHVNGDLLACDAGAKCVKVIGPDGKLRTSWKLDFGPESLDVAADGTVYTGGEGVLAKLDRKGQVLKSVRVSDQVPPPPAEPQPRGPQRKERVSGIAATEKDLFVAYGAGWSLRSRSRLVRFDRELANAAVIAEQLRGCCQRCDIAARDGKVYIAENAAHRVLCLDREGAVLAKWGQQAREGIEGFGSCCNPMNLCFDRAGVLYAAESGLGRVKRYATDGKFLGLVGYVGVERFDQAGHLAASCSNIAIAATPDGARVYVMDYKQNRIRVLQQKPAGR
jgi:sugar lactone lactonase YvrE